MYIDLRFKIRIVLERKLLDNLNAIAIKISRLLGKIGLDKFLSLQILKRQTIGTNKGGRETNDNCRDYGIKGIRNTDSSIRDSTVNF